MEFTVVWVVRSNPRWDGSAPTRSVASARERRAEYMRYGLVVIVERLENGGTPEQELERLQSA
jgi:hypothetical protein